MMKLKLLICTIFIILLGIHYRAASDTQKDSIIDTIPPTVIISNKYEITKPVNGKSTIVLTGSTIDNTGVKSIIWQLFNTQNGKLLSDSGSIKHSAHQASTQPNTNALKWTSNPIQLFPGDNLVTIAASDAQDNIGIQSLNVLIQTINGKIVALVQKTSADRIKSTVFYVPVKPYSKPNG
ncbi:MAG: hypothetical protein ACYC0V_06000 [Armatimonadota bacterium]